MYTVSITGFTFLHLPRTDCYDQHIAEPLRAMVVGAPLEDARHLTERLRQEAEAQSCHSHRLKRSVQYLYSNIYRMLFRRICF
ncbi:hypothetical protein KC19_10G147400 [Ceratodon purpureus]|uniref:Uncharacterized protein n=1 Tax=Ceratodon purpureus TaxID=3225 RepID=A0A8T0GSR7_CERPU|nr:hypothetical protein KC19_10G147400 [Ceratodon purpureus]